MPVHGIRINRLGTATPCAQFVIVRATRPFGRIDCVTCCFGDPARRVCNHRDTTVNPATTNLGDSTVGTLDTSLNIIGPFSEARTDTAGGLCADCWSSETAMTWRLLRSSRGFDDTIGQWPIFKAQVA